MDTLKAIQVFVEIHQQGSLTKAAQKLSLSRAMVSRYLEFLESRLGVRLMQRNARRICLTQDGQEALVSCLAILEQEQKLSQLNVAKRMQGKLRISCGHFLAREYLLDAICQFQLMAPEVTFDVLSQEQSVDLIAQNVDVALRISNRSFEGYQSIALGKMGSWLVASPEYLHTMPNLYYPNDLIEHHALVHSYLPQKHWHLVGQCGLSADYPLNVVFQSNDVYVLLEMALKGKGISMLPIELVAREIASGRLIRVLPDYDVSVYQASALFVQNQHMPVILEKFLAFLPPFFVAQQQKLQQVLAPAVPMMD